MVRPPNIASRGLGIPRYGCAHSPESGVVRRNGERGINPTSSGRPGAERLAGNVPAPPL